MPCGKNFIADSRLIERVSIPHGSIALHSQLPEGLTSALDSKWSTQWLVEILPLGPNTGPENMIGAVIPEWWMKWQNLELLSQTDFGSSMGKVT